MVSQELIPILENFFSQYTKTTYKKGDMLISGATPSGVFMITKGHVRQFFAAQDGSEILSNIYKPYTFFPMIWAIANIDNRYFFDAIDYVEAYRAPKEKFLEFLRKNEEVMWDLTKRSLIGLDATLVRLEHAIHGNATNKVASALIIMANRFSQDPNQKTAINLNLKQETLASLAGTTKETFSRELSKLKEHKIITTNKGQIVIQDLDALKANLTI